MRSPFQSHLLQPGLTSAQQVPLPQGFGDRAEVMLARVQAWVCFQKLGVGIRKGRYAPMTLTWVLGCAVQLLTSTWGSRVHPASRKAVAQQP